MKVNPPLIRFAAIHDYETVSRLVQQVQTLHIELRPDIYKSCDPVLAEEEFLHDLRTSLVAETDGTVVGFLSYTVRHIETPFQVTRDVLYIDTLVVEEAARGQGIGRALLDRLRRIAAEGAYDGIELQVNARNLQAKKLYEAYGFTEKSINMELL